MHNPHKLPITVISGFTNTGKTSVLVDLLHKRNVDQQSAIIMNDIAETVTETNKVREALGKDSHLLLELPNGCICCTLKDVFLQTVEQIAESGVNHLYIESNATAEPSLIQGFLEESVFADRVYIQNMITIIDAATFLTDFFSTDELRDRGLVALTHDDRMTSEVLTEQIEYADTLMVTKGDLVKDADLAFLKEMLATLNPKAKITVVGQNKRDTINQKIDTFIFTAEKPFHPLRLHAALQTDAFSSILRARGIAWIATRPVYKVQWSQTGSICSLESGGPWWNRGASEKENQFNAQWFELCGSRFQNIEFIGAEMNVEQLQKLLESCLLTDVEMKLGSDLWLHFDDPFEQWEHYMDRSLFTVKRCEHHHVHEVH